MPQFIGEQYTAKELANLASWQGWGARKAFLRQIHEENKAKAKAKAKAEQAIFWAVGGAI